MKFVAFLGSDHENWGQVTAIMRRKPWESILLVKKKGTEEFFVPQNTDTIEIDSTLPMVELKSLLLEKLKPKLSGDFEVVLSLASGTGKEHMALLSALLNIPVGVRLVVFTKNGIEFIS